ncbi:MAG: hypothetical protein LBD57_04210 [Endomicrobium sp.]|jgi:hypothetical protein|uniref:hypothetical protein n=1 Tax=Candidatus Endomicrobiellum cubanum TaxID=3242325 RepID=UPI002831D7A6|nr:hypothetical protein [Endomicrobium sp.]
MPDEEVRDVVFQMVHLKDDTPISELYAFILEIDENNNIIVVAATQTDEDGNATFTELEVNKEFIFDVRNKLKEGESYIDHPFYCDKFYVTIGNKYFMGNPIFFTIKPGSPNPVVTKVPVSVYENYSSYFKWEEFKQMMSDNSHLTYNRIAEANQSVSYPLYYWSSTSTHNTYVYIDEMLNDYLNGSEYSLNNDGEGVIMPNGYVVFPLSNYKTAQSYGGITRAIINPKFVLDTSGKCKGHYFISHGVSGLSNGSYILRDFNYIKAVFDDDVSASFSYTGINLTYNQYDDTYESQSIGSSEFYFPSTGKTESLTVYWKNVSPYFMPDGITLFNYNSIYLFTNQYTTVANGLYSLEIYNYLGDLITTNTTPSTMTDTNGVSWAIGKIVFKKIDLNDKTKFRTHNTALMFVYNGTKYSSTLWLKTENDYELFEPDQLNDGDYVFHIGGSARATYNATTKKWTIVQAPNTRYGEYINSDFKGIYNTVEELRTEYSGGSASDYAFVNGDLYIGTNGWELSSLESNISIGSEENETMLDLFNMPIRMLKENFWQNCYFKGLNPFNTIFFSSPRYITDKETGQYIESPGKILVECDEKGVEHEVLLKQLFNIVDILYKKDDHVFSMELPNHIALTRDELKEHEGADPEKETYKTPKKVIDRYVVKGFNLNIFFTIECSSFVTPEGMIILYNDLGFTIYNLLNPTQFEKNYYLIFPENITSRPKCILGPNGKLYFLYNVRDNKVYTTIPAAYTLTIMELDWYAQVYDEIGTIDVPIIYTVNDFFNDASHVYANVSDSDKQSYINQIKRYNLGVGEYLHVGKNDNVFTSVYVGASFDVNSSSSIMFIMFLIEIDIINRTLVRAIPVPSKTIHQINLLPNGNLMWVGRDITRSTFTVSGSAFQVPSAIMEYNIDTQEIIEHDIKDYIGSIARSHPAPLPNGGFCVGRWTMFYPDQGKDIELPIKSFLTNFI